MGTTDYANGAYTTSLFGTAANANYNSLNAASGLDAAMVYRVVKTGNLLIKAENLYRGSDMALYEYFDRYESETAETMAQADLFDNLDNIGTKFYSTTPMSMEECGQNYGYMFYTTDLNANINSEFRIMDLSDRANVFVGKDPVAVFERNVARDTFYLVTGDKEEKLNVLIENMGRINYGSYVADKKGMAGVKLWEVQLFHWTNIALPMDNLEKLCYTDLSEKPSATPTFYKGTLFVDKAEDTFLKPSGFAKGFIVVNGVNIARYYNAAGPQKTLYLPKCYLKDGENEIVIFDSDGASDLTLESVDTPEL